jgi:NodT family efflux transporter outer membrane factor (OMF) lipoprotein
LVPNRVRPWTSRHRARAIACYGILIAAVPACGLLEPLGLGTLVGPDYEQPPAAVESAWLEFRDGRIESEEVRLQTWWSVFSDPVLDGLMARAASDNLTLQSAAERVAFASARRDLAAGFMYPQSQGARGAAGTSRLSELEANSSPDLDRTSTNYAGEAFATWEIDFWGRYRRAVESADAELQASIADYDDVLVLLYAEVASRYVDYRTFQARLRYLRANLLIQQAAFDIAQARFDAGEVAERDVHEARQVLEETRAQIPLAELGLRAQNNALNLLLGLTPRDLSVELGEAGIPRVPESVAVGIPADLLRRRPDVRRAERIAASRSALIGIAESDFYPSISLVGSLGVSAEHSSDLDDSDAQAGFVGATFQWSILDYGRTAANVRAFEAAFRAAVLDYQQAVLRAGSEAEDAIYSLLKTQEVLEPQLATVAAASRTVEIVQDQYAEGEVDFSTVFLFASNLQEQQDRLAVAQGDAAQSLVNLYRVLGGGWSEELPWDGTAGDAPPPTEPDDTSDQGSNP